MSGRGRFFGVEREPWARVCDLGSVNAAVAYLVLARGTLRDMRTTAWSTNAIEERTAIPRLRAKRAIQDIVAAGLVELRRGGTKPQYRLRSLAELDALLRPARPLTEAESQVLAVITAHPDGVVPPRKPRGDGPWPKGNAYSAALMLERRGLIHRSVDGLCTAIAAPSVPPVDWIWLPNSIIDGAIAETPPIERLRQTQDLAALRLFVDLYHAQSLATAECTGGSCVGTSTG